jgi:protein disulfide-isomerase
VMARGTRNTIFLVAAILILAVTAFAGGGATWNTDFRKAIARATRLQRPLLLVFTGSDWCDRCLSLKVEVFDTPEFNVWARKNVVLVEADFPKSVRQKGSLRKQNRKLANRFRDFVQDGYPTVLLLDPTGTRVLGELGYRDGGPIPWVEEADRLVTGTRGPRSDR